MPNPSPTTLDVQMSPSWPTTFNINAYAGSEKAASGIFSDEARRWPLRNAPPKVRTFLKPPKPVDFTNWQDPQVGWGIVAGELPGTKETDLAAGTDLPEPIQSLRKERGNAPVLRYREGWDQRFRLLRNYADKIDVAIGQSPIGTGRECIPHYLLIYGTPDQIPWELQYVLNAHYAVGRLHLVGPALENYINTLRSGWRTSNMSVKQSVVWAVNQGGDDITALMRNLIAAKVNEKLATDNDLSAGVRFLDGAGAATTGEIIKALAASSPALVITTSHGQTYPLDNLDTLGRELGLLVDQNYASLHPQSLLDAWQPDGAVWYAHALDLKLVGLTKPDPSKPHGKAPRFWYWKKFVEWLGEPSGANFKNSEPATLSDLGHNGPAQERRTHVSIQPDSQTSIDGVLFQTRGLEFISLDYDRNGDIEALRRLALAVEIGKDIQIKRGLAALGGERRLVGWRESNVQLPGCPDALRNSIVGHKHCRVVIVTPAYFNKGSRPNWLVSSRDGVNAELLAFAVNRPQVVSGWDFERNETKPTRRLAPAGTVLFLELNGNDEDIKKWIDSIWMQSISDEPQDRLDGFGIALLGDWDGIFKQME